MVAETRKGPKFLGMLPQPRPPANFCPKRRHVYQILSFWFQWLHNKQGCQNVWDAPLAPTPANFRPKRCFLVSYSTNPSCVINLKLLASTSGVSLSHQILDQTSLNSSTVYVIYLLLFINNIVCHVGLGCHEHDIHVSPCTSHLQQLAPCYTQGVEFYLYPTVGTVLIHSVKPELTEQDVIEFGGRSN